MMKRRILMLSGLLTFILLGCTASDNADIVSETVHVTESFEEIKEETGDESSKYIKNEESESESNEEIEYVNLSQGMEADEIEQRLNEYYNQYISNLSMDSHLLNLSIWNGSSVAIHTNVYEGLSGNLQAENDLGYDERVDSILIHRADKKYLSLLETGINEQNEVYYNSRVYDVESGNKVQLNDIVSDMETFNSVICTLMGNNSISLDSINIWTIGYNGLNLYVQAGTEKVSPIFIPYADYPDLFSENIKSLSSNYIFGFNEISDLKADLDDDGIYDTIQIKAEYNDEGYISNITLTDGEQELDCPISESFAEKIGGHYIQKADGSKYIYVYSNTAYDMLNEYSIFKIENGNMIYVESETIFCNFEALTDPESITTLSECLITGLMLDKKYSYINDAGYITSYDDYTYCAQITTFDGDIEGTIVDGDSNIAEGENVIIPEGEIFIILKTEDEKYVDVIILDGRICRLDYSDVNDLDFVRWDNY